MANINLIRTDGEKELKGVWVDFAEGIRLKIARSGNDAYNKLLRELSEPHIDLIRAESLKPENEQSEEYKKLNAAIMVEVRATTILLDWEAIEDENDETVEYSLGQAMEYFRDPSLKDFYVFVRIQSQNIDNFRKEAIDKAVKN